MNSDEIFSQVLIADSSILEAVKSKELITAAKAIGKIIGKVNSALKKENFDLNKTLSIEGRYLEAKLNVSKDELSIPSFKAGLQRVTEAKSCLEQTETVSKYYTLACGITLNQYDALGLPKDSFRKYIQSQITSISNDNRADLLPFQKELNTSRIELLRKTDAVYKKRQIDLMIAIAVNKPESAPAKNFINKLSSGQVTKTKQQILDHLDKSRKEIESQKNYKGLQKNSMNR